MMINPTAAFLVFVICAGLFGIFVGLKNRESRDSLQKRRSFLKGCFTVLVGSIVLSLFASGVFGSWVAIGTTGILLLLQEYAAVAINRLHARKDGSQAFAINKQAAEIELKGRWEQIRKKGLRHFVLVNTASYALGGVVLASFGAVFSPERVPSYLWAVMILAGAVGGATAAIRQWNWNERKYLPHR